MKKFISGALMYGALRSIEQDLIGKENYMKAIDLLWVDASITIPIALLLIVVAIFLFMED